MLFKSIVWLSMLRVLLYVVFVFPFFPIGVTVSEEVRSPVMVTAIGVVFGKSMSMV